jgi:hypothetical protein
MELRLLDHKESLREVRVSREGLNSANRGHGSDLDQ